MSRTARVARIAQIGLIALLAAGCATLPPGSDFPKAPSAALANPEQTWLGRQFDEAARAHDGNSAFRLVSVGVDGFLVRAEMIDAAERTLDLEYYIFRQDETGRLLTDALVRAADRGVRVRLLIDDGETTDGDERIDALAAHRNVEIRIFNPFAYRGHSGELRALEFLLDAPRLDYRMHNKLFVVDNAIALVGGRNIGDQYFQVDPKSRFGDDDVFAAGPIVKDLSASFDEFWNSALAIPAAALARERPDREDLAAYREELTAHRREATAEGADYAKRIATGEPLAGMLSGRTPLVWAPAQLVYDSPQKRAVEKGEMLGELMHRAVAQAASSVQSELLMVTPFFIPGKGGMRLLTKLRERGVRVAVLTNSLESTPQPIAQSGYMHYRVPLLESGVELYEVRAFLGSACGSGESKAATLSGGYALHAKLFVFDRQRVYVGSMNFDERSHHLNTEIGLIIDSPALAEQAAARFAAIIAPANSYRVMLRRGDGEGSGRLVWLTEEHGAPVEYDNEPARDEWQRMKVELLSLLPLDGEL